MSFSTRQTFPFNILLPVLITSLNTLLSKCDYFQNIYTHMYVIIYEGNLYLANAKKTFLQLILKQKSRGNVFTLEIIF